MWITIEAERALYVDPGRDVILCDRGHRGRVTLVIKVPDDINNAGNAMTNFEPGWLKRDVDRASQRVREWRAQAMTYMRMEDALADIERLRALLLRHQVAAWCEEDSDLAVETRRALETKP